MTLSKQRVRGWHDDLPTIPIERLLLIPIAVSQVLGTKGIDIQPSILLNKMNKEILVISWMGEKLYPGFVNTWENHHCFCEWSNHSQNEHLVSQLCLWMIGSWSFTKWMDPVRAEFSGRDRLSVHHWPSWITSRFVNDRVAIVHKSEGAPPRSVCEQFNNSQNHEWTKQPIHKTVSE